MAQAFLDTNVLLYLLSADAAKADVAEHLVSGGGHVSVQVLNEFVSVARRRAGLEWVEIDEVTEPVRRTCIVHPLTVELHDAARALARKYALNIYDATIVASAIMADCDVLYSEDFQEGQRFEGVLRVKNPFRVAR